MKGKEGPIYSFDQMRDLLQEKEPSLKAFFNQFYLAARPMLSSCFAKFNCLKFDLAYYLDSAGTSNEGLNTMANLGATTTSRAVDRKKKKTSDEHEEYVLWAI